MHQFVGNWGWAIIALTILINLAMFPLRQKAVTSMRKMQEIQPQMKAIQERYAKYKVTDPQRQKMNEEVMALYKAKGVNPASGCVPMLLTLPFLFAFYAHALAGHRDSRRRFLRLDHRPVAARSALHHAAADGRDDVLAAEDRADLGRPGPAAGDDDHAA